jgi:DNA-binding PadR family transcriptional regulator
MNDTTQDFRKFLPLTAAVFQILLVLYEGEQHGYKIMKSVGINSGGKFIMRPGTLYGTIKRMLSDGMIEEAGERPDPVMEDERRRYYKITELGRKVVRAEAERLEILVASAKIKKILSSQQAQ